MGQFLTATLEVEERRPEVGLLLTFTPGFAIKPGENVELFLPGFSGSAECFEVTPQPQTPNPKP